MISMRLRRLYRRLSWRVAEIDRAIEALDREIAAAEGRRFVRQVRVTTSKGL